MTSPHGPTRRGFLQTSAAATAALSLPPLVHASGSDTIKVGLIGCGGRGTGAADNCLNSAPGVKLVAVGDAFADRIDSCLSNLAKLGDKVEVGDRKFVGLDAYKNVIESDVDLVLLATPPGFRPLHLEAAVAAGKHIFTEKPVGVDAPGIRRVLAAYEAAKEKMLGIVAGTQRRHQDDYLASMEQIHNGALGEIVSGRVYWNQGGLWHKARVNGMTDAEWQIRNWLYFTWLSGDHIVEQHVHNLDVANWALGEHPIRAVGMGGRQSRTAPEYGHIFDHFAVQYEYPSGTVIQSYCRQIDGCENNVSETIEGTQGKWTSQGHRITHGGKVKWRYRADGKRVDSYVQEHTHLIESIRKGEPLNELKTVAESTLTAIMGRMSAYTGKAIEWDQALNSQENLYPADLTLESSLPVPPVAIPGRTPFV
jgi:predicted dehydrogenase